MKGHEPKLYEALRVAVGLFFEFTIVKMKGPNKRINDKKMTYQCADVLPALQSLSI